MTSHSLCCCLSRRSTPRPTARRRPRSCLRRSTYLANSAALALQASTRLTGVVVESGDGVTHIVPFHDGHALQHSITRLDIGGRDVTDQLIALLATERGITFPALVEREIVGNIKETMTHVALNFQQELQLAETPESGLGITYELSDGQEVVLRNEHFRCVEPLFQPSLLSRNHVSIHQAVHDAISKCPADIRDELYANIVLAGGNTLFSGMAERVQQEITALAPQSAVNVVPPPEREFAVWIGGCMTASLLEFPDMWVSKAEYEEAGPGAVHAKFS